MTRLLYNPDKKVLNVIEEIIAGYSRSTRHVNLLKANYESLIEDLTSSEINYIENVTRQSLHEIEMRSNVCGVEKDTMNYLFDNRLKKEVYIPLLKSPTCPYCDGPMANTVDHVLPKERFVQYTLTPCNLVPSCRDCNSNKDIYVSQCEKTNPFHPYFEDIKFRNYIEGKCSISSDNELTVEIIVQEVSDTDTTLEKKQERYRYFENYYNIFKLNIIYNAMAIRQYNEFIRTLIKFSNDLNYIYVKEMIESECSKLNYVDDVVGEQYYVHALLNEQYIKFTVYKSLQDNYNDCVYRCILRKVSYERERLGMN